MVNVDHAVLIVMRASVIIIKAIIKLLSIMHTLCVCCVIEMKNIHKNIIEKRRTPHATSHQINIGAKRFCLCTFMGFYREKFVLNNTQKYHYNRL